VGSVRPAVESVSARILGKSTCSSFGMQLEITSQLGERRAHRGELRVTVAVHGVNLVDEGANPRQFVVQEAMMRRLDVIDELVRSHGRPVGLDVGGLRCDLPQEVVRVDADLGARCRPTAVSATTVRPTAICRKPSTFGRGTWRLAPSRCTATTVATASAPATTCTSSAVASAARPTATASAIVRVEPPAGRRCKRAICERT
jgi:hypothetical protein